MTTPHVPTQRTAPEEVAATAATAPATAGWVELGWGRILRVGAARALLATAASLLVWSLLPLTLGWTPHVILSGSMEPRIHVGDVIVTKRVAASTLAVGQVVTVVDPDHPGRTRTHRLLRQEADGSIVTKGDANPQADSSHVRPSAVLGVGVIRVPYVGRPAYWTAQHDYLALGGTALVLAWAGVSAFAPTRRRRELADTIDHDRDHDRDDDHTDEQGPRPPSPSRGARRARRLAATAAVAAVAVGAVATPADAAFLAAASNPTSTLSAASTFYAYRSAVMADSPYLFWRLDETGGTVVDDETSAGRDGTLLSGGSSWGATGPITGESTNRALATTTAAINAGSSSAGGQGPFSVEAWIKTTSTTGGRILGFGNATGQSPSTTVDRQLYLAPTGKVYFGIGSAKTTVASGSALNNGAWHHVVGTYTSGANGMRLYVDGVLQGQATATPQSFTGYWRAAAEHLSGWPGNPADDYFDGTLDELAVYTAALSPARVKAHFDAARN